MVLDGQPEPPRYFAEMKRINRDGAPVLGELVPLPQSDGASIAKRILETSETAWLIDLRPARAFAAQHVPGSLSVPYGRSFSTWVGSIVPYDVDVVLVAPADGVTQVASARADLLRIGMDRVTGWVLADELLPAFTAAGGRLGRIEWRPVASAEVRDGTLPVVDVRGRSEWMAGHLPTAQHIPLGELAAHVGELPAGPFGVQCQSGARSAIATSLLHRLGRTDAINLEGGYAAWRLVNA